MSIQNPSQYDCDNMEVGDLVYIKHRGIFYRWYRKHFLKDKIKIKVKTNWKKPYTYNEYYQEDCTLIFFYELQCVQKLENEVPCVISYKNMENVIKTFNLKELQVGLYNIQLIFKNNIIITIPTSNVDNAFKQNQMLLKTIENKKLIDEQLRFQKYKGDTFKNIVLNKNIQNWNASYCSVCGKPIVFSFNEDSVIVNNECECGNTSLNIEKLSYDEFAIWYCSQTNKTTVNYYKRFWFSKEV